VLSSVATSSRGTARSSSRRSSGSSCATLTLLSLKSGHTAAVSDLIEIGLLLCLHRSNVENRD
jgi:hypothetical protein